MAMNDKQKEALEIALTGHNLLILGSAGTGKSFVVKEIEKQLRGLGKNVKITCSTGIACGVYDHACTVHQFTGILDGRHGPDEICNVLNHNRKYDTVVKNIKECDVLIVDECSMISSRTFDIISRACTIKDNSNDIISRACTIKDNSKVFGGMQVIFCGDFFQLPPVANKMYQDDVYSPTLLKDIAEREQYPLKPAFGLTIHKAQGMTLSRVQIYCSGIFKAGQLGVAMSRARTTEGLRVINFNRKYVIPPSHQVTEFMKEQTQKILSPDLSCCREHKGEVLPTVTVIPDPEVHVAPDVATPSTEVEDTETNIESFDSDIEDDFNEVLYSICQQEEKCTDFELPEDFKINLEEMKFCTETTEFHKIHNRTLSNINDESLELFLKKVFFKCQEFVKHLNVNIDNPKGIPEKKIAQFYREVHQYSVGSDYKLNCLLLFQNENSFSDVHQGICYSILEVVRVYFIKQKADVFKLTERTMMKRQVTDASKVRIRYVAGYCVANLRNKYMKKKKANLFTRSADGQTLYDHAKLSLIILDTLKEEEQFLHASTCDPDSLLDIDRRQGLSRGLTNVSDHFYKFFLELTDKCLTLLINENLLQYGQSMYNMCLDKLKAHTKLFDIYFKAVMGKLSSSQDPFPISMLKNQVSLTSEIRSIYDEMNAKYLLVLFSQFRKDMKATLRVEKSLAHRKQIKVSKKKGAKQAEVSSVSGISSEVLVEATSEVASTSTLEEIPLTEEMPETEEMSESEKCGECKLDHNNDNWILCDTCNCWFHRECAGLKHHARWKKISKENVQWHCKNCNVPEEKSQKKRKRAKDR